MKQNLPFVLMLVLFMFNVSASSQLSQKVFLESYGVTGTQEMFYKTSVVRGVDGFSYVCGATLNSDGNYDMLLTKMTRNNVVVWSQQYAGLAGGDDFAADLVLDGVGNIIITGAEYISATNYNAITIKYNTSGVQLWLKSYNGVANSFDGGVSIVRDASNSIYICGGSYGVNTFSDFLCIKYNSNGVQQWVNTWNGANMQDISARLAVSATQVSVVGASQQSVNDWKMASTFFNVNTGAFIGVKLSGGDDEGIDKVADLAIDGSDNTYVVGAVKNINQQYDIKIIKLSPTYAVLWQKTYNGISNLNDEGLSLELTSTNDVIICGFTTTIEEDKNFITQKYAGSNGLLIWSKTFDEQNGEDKATDLKLDLNGNAIICGSSYKDGNVDYVVQKLKENSGEIIWMGRWNGDSNMNDLPMNLAIDENDNTVYVAGQTEITEGSFKYMVTRWSQKNVYMPVPTDGFSTSGGYVTNKGQLRNHDGTSNTNVKFYNATSRIATYVDNRFISYQLAQGTEANDTDTTFKVEMEFTKGNTSSNVYPMNIRREYYNYYLGHMAKVSERTEIANAALRFESYTNTDVIFTHSSSGFRHWIVARTGSPTGDFEMTFKGQTGLSVDVSGNLKVSTAIGDIVFTKVKAYSMNNSTGALTLLGWQPSYSINGNAVQFTGFGSWSGTLVLEYGRPVQSGAVSDNDWYSYWGGPAKDEAMDIIVDEDGSVYVTGLTESIAFPNVTGGFTSDFEELSDIFLCKFDENGAIQVGTFFGGNGYDVPFALTQNSFGDIYVVGQTQSDNLVIESDDGIELQGMRDGFICRFNSTLDNLLFSRYIGAEIDNSIDVATDIAVDLDDEVFVVGTTGGGNGSGFPIMSMSGAYNQITSSISSANNPDGYVLKFNESNEQLWGTYFGGSELEHISSIEIKPSISGEFMILGSTFSSNPASSDDSNTPCGVPNAPSFFPDCESFGMFEPFNSDGFDHEMFIAEFNNSGQLIWSTYFGGQDHESSTFQLLFKMSDIIYDKNDSEVKFVIGTTSGTDFLTSALDPPSYVQNQNFIGSTGRAFVMRLNGHTPEWSTVYGCNSITWGITASCDDDSNLYLAGISRFSEYGALSCVPQADEINEFPKCQLANIYFQEQYNGGQGGDVFIAGFDSGDELQWSTYFGGDNGDEVRASAFDDLNDRLYVIGRTNSISTFPLSDPIEENFQQNENAGGFDAFIARFDIQGSLTSVQDIDNDEISLSLSIFPNPSSGDLTLKFNGLAFGTSKVEILDVSGRLVYSESIVVEQGMNSVVIRTSNLSAGTYLIRLDDGSSSILSSFIRLKD